MTKLFPKLNLTKLFSKLEIITLIHQPEWPKKLFTAQCSSLPGIDWREGISQIVKCVGVETPHCGDVVDPHCQYVVDPHFKCGGPDIIRTYQRMNVNLHYSDPQYICIYSHMKCGNPHCSTIHPHCSTLHPHSNCGDVVDPQCIHILRVKVHIASTSQVIWTHSSTSDH